MNEIITSRSLYVTSVVYGYLLVFLVVVPIAGLLIGGELKNAMSIFTLLIAIPITILALFIGYPVFRYIIRKFGNISLIEILVSGISSAFVCTTMLIIIFLIITKSSISDIRFATFLLPPILGVSSISSIIYWLRTKS